MIISDAEKGITHQRRGEARETSASGSARLAVRAWPRVASAIAKQTRGLIERQPGTHRYGVTPYGLRVSFFYSKLFLRIFRPHAPALQPYSDDLPRPLRAALE